MVLCLSDFLFLFSVRGSHGFGNELRFLFVYSCMLRAILCFASTTFLSGIASPTSDLYPVTSWTLQDTPNWDTASPHESCHHDAPTVARFPLTGTATGPRRVVCGTSHAARKPNRIGSHATFEEGQVTQAKVRMDVHQRWALIWRDVGFVAL